MAVTIYAPTGISVEVIARDPIIDGGSPIDSGSPISPPPPPTSFPLDSLPANTARHLGRYNDPDPQFTNTVPRTWPGASGNAQIDSRNMVDDGGMFFDAARNRVVIQGGGHGPGVQTNFRVFDMATLTWSNLHPSTPLSEMVYSYVTANNNIDQDKGRYHSSNQPTSRHRYRLYMAVGNRYYCLMYEGMPDWIIPHAYDVKPDGTQDLTKPFWGGRCYWYDLDTQTYTYSQLPMSGTPWGWSDAGALDPVSGKILILGEGQSGVASSHMWLYDPASDTFATGPALLGANAVGYCHDLIYRAIDDRFYAVQADGRVWKIALDRTTLANSTITLLPVTGTLPGQALGYNVGVALDTVNDLIGGLIQSGVIFLFDPKTNVWSKSTMVVETNPYNMTAPGQADACLIFDAVSGCYIFLDNPPYPWGTTVPTTWAYRYAGAGTHGVTSGGTGTSTKSGMVTTLDFGGGNVATFAQDTAVDQGDFVGEFVQQKCAMAVDPAFPDWRVFFRPDPDGSRQEVVVEYGRATSGSGLHHFAPYTATIKQGNATLYSNVVPYHFWSSRWRWQSKPRPIVRDRAEIIKRGWMPKLSTEGMFGRGTVPYNVTWPGPMRAPARVPSGYPGSENTFQPAMYVGGDREEIGLLTEAGAAYLLFGDAGSLTTTITAGEWTGNWPIHVRNDDGSMFAVRDAVTHYKNSGGTVNRDRDTDPVTGVGYWQTYPGYVAPEAAHWYPCANLPWMLTDDPYYLEALQFGITDRILYNWTPRQKTGLGGLIPPGQTRAFAWGLRDLFHLVATCPQSVPRWLLPRAHWQACLDDNKAFAMQYVNSTARVHSLFRTWTRPDMDRAWMAAWLTTAVGMGVLAGFADWRPIFDWSVGKQIAMSDGTSGWNRQWPVPYGTMAMTDPSRYATGIQYPMDQATTDPITVKTWAEYWNWYKSGTGGKSDDTGHTIDDSGWDGHTLMADLTYYPAAGYWSYFVHLRAAIAIAVKLGVPGAQSIYNWLQPEMTAKMAAKFPDMGGQARFAVAPA